MTRTILFLLFSFVFIYTNLIAQPSACLNGRYAEDLFPEVDISLAQPFGQANTLAGVPKTLLMDIYEPKNDTAPARAAIILAHGGSFFTGNRFDMGEICLAFAKKGYLCASIDYRLIDRLVLDSIAITEAVLMSVSDMKAAIRFFKEDADTENRYRVAPDQVIIGGVSAGAILADQAAYLDSLDDIPDYVQTLLEKHGGFQGNSSDNLQYDHGVMGVINYSGAMLRDHWISPGEPPLFSVHEEFDQVVPCRLGRTVAVPFPVFLYGSCELDQQALAVGVQQEFVFFENSFQHVAYAEGAALGPIINQTARFFQDQLCSIRTSVSPANIAMATVYPNPGHGSFYVDVSHAIPAHLRLYNLQGKAVYEAQIESSQSFSFPSLPAGTYSIELRQNGQVWRTKWVNLP